MTKSSCIVIALVAGCASGGKPGVAPDTGGDDQPDAPGRPDAADIDAPSHVDAAMPDAPQQPVTVTLQETVNNTIAAANSIACGNSTGTTDNTWYRAFALSDFAITNAFHVTQVSFGIQESAGTPSVQVKVGSYSGTVGGATIDVNAITPLNATQVTIPATSTGESVAAPITADIPAGGKLVVQIASPDLSGTNKYVYIGASNGGENKPSYITSVGCMPPISAPTRPIDIDPVSFPNVDMIILVTGTHLM